MSADKPAGQGSVTLQGIGVSPGVVVGPACVLRPEATMVPQRSLSAGEVDLEVCRLEDAVIETRRQLKRIQSDVDHGTVIHDAGMLDIHLMVLDDRTLIEEIVSGIRDRQLNAEAIVQDVTDRYAKVLATLKDEYIRERVVDIRDVSRRIIRNLSGESKSRVPVLTKQHIVVAHDLAPSETAALKKDLVLGFATDLGSPTSHTAVMARMLEIPAIVSLRDVSPQVKTGDEVLLDGNKGVFILKPTSDQLENYGRVAEARRSIQRELTSLQHEPAETKDQHRIVLSANAEGTEEIDAVIAYGAEGIGLFRSEYLYMLRDRAVSEEEQAEVYTEVAGRLDPAPVIIRTLDLGGDKYLPEADAPREANPFLGCRSIRLSLLHPEHFKSQLRAILRASAIGNVKVMYPMISSVDEVRRANALLEEAKQDLTGRGVSYRKDIEVGIMIEIPSAALTADAIAPEVDFFSLGTNDLVQYTLAVDRVNERVAHLYQPTHPAVLKLIQTAIDAGHRQGIWVGLCGEMAADPVLTPLLLGLGVDELSMAPAAVPMIKDAGRSVTYKRTKELADTALTCSSASEVLKHCRSLTQEVAPELLELI